MDNQKRESIGHLPLRVMIDHLRSGIKPAAENNA
jgi:hypothetical protein